MERYARSGDRSDEKRNGRGPKKPISRRRGCAPSAARMKNIVNGNGGDREPPNPTALAILSRLERIERLLDDFAGTFLNARFPYGKPQDRWPRRS